MRFKASTFVLLLVFLSACHQEANIQDMDMDGHGALVSGGDDCNDYDPLIFPGAEDPCDGLDNGCYNYIARPEIDEDQDGYIRCLAAVGQFYKKSGDCDDGNAEVHPGVLEVCNGIDDDCNGINDAERDFDDDGFLLCLRNGEPLDCDDHNKARRPNFPERCDGIDNDCNSASGGREVDADHDGEYYCPDQSDDHGDCNDRNARVNSDAEDVDECDGVDTNCNGDNGYDWDNDGWSSCPISQHNPNGGDCNDDSKEVHPNATEVCANGFDENCNGKFDEGCPSPAP